MMNCASYSFVLSILLSSPSASISHYSPSTPTVS
ncbi:hypothetical protein GLYMA_08G049651v4 [Glycine max]|uniref:Uncharacterized protein n=1 Tax=Glycine soja TaxID=3848 RepID=A0A0B2NSS7_GLYSO|nr:hypothetical protein GLYMA_08G049651v4 [Glycine max]KAH1049688.1 hypothetical protein GYH30_020279 [Glycine max]KHN00191.1 hypothetical protein glysoja_028719 [Glycine soja]